jgi:hypothetical protein
MKKILGFALVIALAASAPSYAQGKVDKAAHGVKKGAVKAWHGTKKGAKKVGNESKELAAKGKARVTDKKSDYWTGPEGQTIYIDGDRYYWINGNGKRIYVSKSALKARNKS